MTAVEDASRQEADVNRPRALIDASPLAVVEVDPDGVVTEWNPAAHRLLGWSRAETLGRPLPTRMVGREFDVTRLLRGLRAKGEMRARQWRVRRRNGRSVDVEVNVALTRDEGGEVAGAAAFFVDVTERNRLERQLRHQVQHDPLTGLPNRTLLVQRLQAALTTAEGGKAVGVLLADLDRFKEVNESLGHAAGDQLLAQIGPRLLSVALRQDDVLARMSGNGFGILLPRLRNAQDAVAVAERVRKALHTPFHLDAGTTVDVAASIGIAVAPEHGDDPDELLRQADSAMYVAKADVAGIVVHEPERERHAAHRLQLLGELRRAMKRDELVLHYQPKVDLGTGRLHGVEALVRWQHPERGLLGPGGFIPMAETTGLIQQLTLKVLDLALAQCRRWEQEGLAVPVAVNLSARCLHDLTLPGRVRAALDHYGLQPALLRLEITESAIMADPEKALGVLGELAGMGVHLALDDFGTGYSSMSYLRRLPVDELKVDRSFVLELTSQEADRVLVRSAVDLGHNLGLTVVAEGVEDARTGEVLHELGCDVAQGYHYARPMPAEQLRDWIRGEAG